MASVTRRARPVLLLAGAGLAVAIAVLLVTGSILPLGATEKAAAPRPPAVRAATLAEMEAAAARATTALVARDQAAWRAALPATGDARRSAARLYRSLARLPWTRVRIIAEPVEGTPGRFYVGAAGELGGADPADRIMARRVYDAEVRAGRVTLRDDVTPADIRGQQVMAFERPVVVRRNGLVVIADRAERAAAEELARAGAEARARLRLLGITAKEPVVVYYYASRRQLLRALGEDPGEARIRFFSRAPLHLSQAPTWTRDIGVLGPALAGKEAWTPRMLAHELTHAYTSSWFSGTRHAPTLLAEGLATAVEGGRSFARLRADLGSGRESYPLEQALRARSLWRGNPLPKVRLAYLEGASLVLYVLDRWDVPRLEAFVRAVADSDLRRKGLDAAARDSLGVGWDELRSGWESHVNTLP